LWIDCSDEQGESMSKKFLAEQIDDETTDLPPDVGPALKLLGTVLTEKFWKEGEFLSKEERKNNPGPLALVERSDIQIRAGNRLITLIPSHESKPMVSIPVGQSDKRTPATIPREWLIGTFLDGMLSLFEGNTEVVWKYVQNINAAIDAAAEIDEDNGKMKINPKKLGAHHHPVEVAEMLESMKRQYTSRSNGSAVLNFGIEITELQPIDPKPAPTELPSNQMAERLLSSITHNSTPEEEQEVSEVLSPLTDPEPALTEADDASPHELADEVEELVSVVADPTPPVDTANPHNFKKEPMEWVKWQMSSLWLDNEDEDANLTIEDIAELAGCHVQTIKRVLDQFEASVTDEDHIEHNGHSGGWTELGFNLNDTLRLLITCERSPTGRYARGRPICFRVASKLDLPFGGPTTIDDIPLAALFDEEPTSRESVEAEWEDIIADAEPVLLEDPPYDGTLKAFDDTDPSLHPCPDCGTMIKAEECPKEAPDFVCGDCHAMRVNEDEQWAEETQQRLAQQAIYEGTALDIAEVEEPVPEPVAEAPAKRTAEDQFPISQLIGRGGQ
jgi:hypothetical protein